MAGSRGTGSSGTGRAFRSALVTIGLGVVLAVVVGVVGLAQGDVARGLASWGSPVFFVSVVVAVFLAFRSGSVAEPPAGPATDATSTSLHRASQLFRDAFPSSSTEPDRIAPCW